MTDDESVPDGGDEVVPDSGPATDGGTEAASGVDARLGREADHADRLDRDADHADRIGGEAVGETDAAAGVDLRGTAVGAAQVAVREYRLAVRRRWAVGVAVLFALFSASLVFLGGSGVGPARVDAVLASFAQVGVYLVPLAALAVGYDAVVGADESGSLELLAALPLSSASVVVGKYLGRAAALGGGMLVGFAVGGALLVRYAGASALGAYAAVVLSAVAAALAFLAVSVLASTLAGEKTHALGAVLATWVWFVLVHDLAALGLVATLDLPQWAVSAAVLLNPADLFRVLVLSGIPTTAGGIAGVLETASLEPTALAAALAAWTAVPLAAAVAAFRRRSL
ncbi:ABC transporter permease [Halobacterium yunchengense]|uniref:ABC transporter permease n=1 Tax=Halobacterium yunchengense TaxID=3108497 RepID=UPI0030085A5D